MAANAGNAKVRLELFRPFGKQFRHLKRMGTGRKERRIVSFCRGRKRLAIQGGKCARFGEPRWWRKLGWRRRPRAQVKNLASFIGFKLACREELFPARILEVDMCFGGCRRL